MIKQELHFIDEAGDPGNYRRKNKSTWYYILTDVIVTPEQIRQLRLKIASIRYLFNYGAELKSHKVSPHLQRKILEILKELNLKIFTLFVDKRKIKISSQENFLKTSYRKLLKEALGKRKSEIVIDQTDKIISIKLDEFLLNKFRPQVKRVNLANSEYVDLLQIADIVTGCFKESLVNKEKGGWEIIKRRVRMILKP